MARALVVALREIRSYFHDRGDLAFTLLLPALIFALMYGAFGGESLFHGTAYIVNQDPGGVYSTQLLDRLGKLDNLDVTLVSSPLAEDKLNKADLQLVTYIPADFSTNVAHGWEAKIIFRQRGNGGQEGQIVASIIRGKAQEVCQEVAVKKQVRNVTETSQAHADETVQKFLDRESASPFVSVQEIPIGSAPDPVNQFLSGIVTMFVIFATTISSRTLVEERNNKTLERLLTTRLTIRELFAGKFLSNTARAFMQTFILLAAAYVVFRPFTPVSFLETLVIALVFSAAAGALGILIGSFSKSRDQANWIAVLVTMAMTMLGGTFFTVNEGSALYPLSRMSLNTYANEAFRTVMSRGGSLYDVGTQLAVIAAAALAILVLGRVLFRVVAGGK